MEKSKEALEAVTNKMISARNEAKKAFYNLYSEFCRYIETFSGRKAII